MKVVSFRLYDYNQKTVILSFELMMVKGWRKLAWNYAHTWAENNKVWDSHGRILPNHELFAKGTQSVHIVPY